MAREAKKQDKTSAKTEASASSFSLYSRAVAVLVVFFASTQTGFSNSFVGKEVVKFASCVAYDQEQTMGGCLSNVLGGIFGTGTAAGSQNEPVQGSSSQGYGSTVHQPANVPDKVFNEHRRPQNHYDAQGSRIFPDAIPYREEADYHAKLRASKFEESQKAYRSGHKANAHELSVEGKKHGHLMEEANKKAAQAIIKPQNSDTTGVLDLHGLYVAEATEAATAFLLKQEKAKRFREVEIITGAGHHSHGHEAKIRPAVERLISGMDLPYHHPPHNDGAFVVEMYRNQD